MSEENTQNENEIQQETINYTTISLTDGRFFEVQKIIAEGNLLDTDGETVLMANTGVSFEPEGAVTLETQINNEILGL